jgi:hypothetical protein
MSQTFAFADVPDEIKTKSGAAHTSKILQVQEIMRQEYGPDIAVEAVGTNWRNFGVHIVASQKNFYGDGADVRLRDAFKAAVKTYMSRKK